jgi:hypothetical protein
MATAAMSELDQELARNTGIVPSGRYAVVAYEMPLVHRCGSRRIESLLATLDARTCLEPGEGSQNRAALGLSGHVYQWLGPSAYEETDLILVWEAAQDPALPGSVSPWDTGGLLSKGTVGRRLVEDEARTLVERYSFELMPGRAYLGSVLECCFTDPADYLDGRTPSRWYPGWIDGAVPRDTLPPAHTFEVRRPQLVPLRDHLIAAIVDESAFADRSKMLRGLRNQLREVNGRYVPCRPRERCGAAARAFVWQHLRDRGAL